MFKKIVFISVVYSVIMLSLTTQAKELADRKGFLIGLGPVVGAETNLIKKFGGGIGARIGGAFNERFQLYYEDLSLFTSKDGHFIALFNGMATFQAFLVHNMYAKAGVGFSVADVQTTGNDYREQWGLGVDGGVGYEFRITKHFVIAPEVIFNYQRIKGYNYYMPVGYLHFGWYL